MYASDRALSTIARCVTRSFGGPEVLPSGKSVKTARGGLADAVMLHALVTDVVVTPDGGEPVRMGAGDLVTFPAGLECHWEIQAPVRKHYTLR